MADTPRLVLPEITVGQSQKETTHNEALRILDAVVQSVAIDKDLFVPPGSPSDGDTYIVAATDSTSGDWETHDDEIAYYQSSGWIFVVPFEGFRLFVADEDIYYRYVSASDGWEADSATFLGQTDTPSSYSGQGEKVLRVNTGETAVEFVPHYEEYTGFINGKPAAGEVLLRVPVTQALNFPDDLAGSQGVCEIAVATSDGVTFSIKKDGVEFATMTIDDGATVATFATASTDTDFAAGDVLTVEAPNPQDATMEDVGFALRATLT
jgi:hypothetical protein